MVALLHDYRKNPVELFDGLEPLTLTFRPATFGLPDYEPVDLVVACSVRPEKTFSPEVQHELNSLALPRVEAFDKSGSRWESLLGYYAVARSVTQTDCLVILFSFFEVSPARFLVYLHALLKAV